MKKTKKYKIERGSLEEEREQEERKLYNAKAFLFLLPIIMIAVLVLGAYFGYLSFKSSEQSSKKERQFSAATALEDENDFELMRTVNSANPLESTYVPETIQFGNAYISPVVKDSLEKMLEDAESEGLKITLIEGYISFEEQKKRYEEAVAEYKKSSKASTVKAEAYVKKTIPREGESEQQTGLMIYLSADTKEDFVDTKQYSWLLKNCVNYGFVLRYPETENAGSLMFSPHYFRYVGLKNAYSMRAYDMSLDEYSQYLYSR